MFCVAKIVRLLLLLSRCAVAAVVVMLMLMLMRIVMLLLMLLLLQCRFPLGFARIAHHQAALTLGRAQCVCVDDRKRPPDWRRRVRVTGRVARALRNEIEINR